MIPIRTSVEVDEIPGAVIGLIVVNLAVFLFMIGLSGDAAERFIYDHALVPARYTHPEFARSFGLDPRDIWPLLTNTFMHAGWFHLIVNMWTLWLFGAALEQRMGAARFILVYLVCGAVASLAHFAFNLGSPLPALGSSGAIAGVLGGYTLIYPRAKVVVLTPVLFFPIAFPLPAVVYTAIWFVLQLLQGVADLGAPDDVGGVAWWAHIGGFLAGLALVRLVGAPGRSSRLIGAARRRVVVVGAQRVGVIRVGARPLKIRAARATTTAQRPASVPPRRAAPSRPVRDSATGRPDGADRGSLGQRFDVLMAEAFWNTHKDTAEASKTEDAPFAEPTRRGPWG